MNKKQAAHQLYINGISHEQIAELLKVSYHSVAKWSSEGNWKNEKNQNSLQQQTIQDRIQSLIYYQLDIIKRITEIKSNDLSHSTSPEELKQAMIQRGDIDALQKLFTTVKGKEIPWEKTVKQTRELLEFIESQDLALAKEVAPLANEWLLTKRDD